MIQFNPIQQKHKEDTNGRFVYFNRILKHIMKPMDFQWNLEAPRFGSVNFADCIFVKIRIPTAA